MKTGYFDLEKLRTLDLPQGALLAVKQNNNDAEYYFHTGDGVLKNYRQESHIAKILPQHPFILCRDNIKYCTPHCREVENLQVIAVPEAVNRISSKHMTSQEEFFAALLNSDRCSEKNILQYFQQRFGKVFVIHFSPEPARRIRCWKMEATENSPEVQFKWISFLQDQWFIPGIDDKMQHSLSMESADGKIKIIKCTFYAGDINSCLEKLRHILQRNKMTEDIAGIIPLELSILAQYFPEGNIISHLNFGSEILL